jgi:hypothetical protein
MFPPDFEKQLTTENTSDEPQFIGDSFCIATAKYVGSTLTLEFQEGQIYEYYNVHRFVWYNLQRTVSKGEFFNKNIRNRGYSFSRLR